MQVNRIQSMPIVAQTNKQAFSQGIITEKVTDPINNLSFGAKTPKEIDEVVFEVNNIAKELTGRLKWLSFNRSKKTLPAVNDFIQSLYEKSDEVKKGVALYQERNARHDTLFQTICASHRDDRYVVANGYLDFIKSLDPSIRAQLYSLRGFGELQYETAAKNVNIALAINVLEDMATVAPKQLVQLDVIFKPVQESNLFRKIGDIIVEHPDLSDHEKLQFLVRNNHFDQFSNSISKLESKYK